MIFLQIVDGVWTCGVFYNIPLWTDAYVVYLQIVLVCVLVAEGNIARFALVCAQVDTYLCPRAGSIAWRGQQRKVLRVVAGSRDVHIIFFVIFSVVAHPVFQRAAQSHLWRNEPRVSGIGRAVIPAPDNS